jgi:putative two-component system response regulator
MPSDGITAQQWQQRENPNGASGEQALRLQGTVKVLVNKGDAGDWAADGHGRRVQEYARVLATALSRFPKFAGVATDRWIARVGTGALLHDVGKVAIPNAILRKPAPLTSAEFDIMKTHCWIGHDVIVGTEKCWHHLQEPLSRHQEDQWWVTAKEIALSHHERWNGSGYPQGLVGDAIPLSARVVALADVFDAATSPRVYKAPLPTEEVAEIVVNSSGTSFDPEVVEAYLLVREEFGRIAEASTRALGAYADRPWQCRNDRVYCHFDHPTVAALR